MRIKESGQERKIMYPISYLLMSVKVQINKENNVTVEANKYERHTKFSRPVNVKRHSRKYNIKNTLTKFLEAIAVDMPTMQVVQS